MQINLENKTALVCGSSQGIGLAIAKELANAGANIILLARNSEKLQSLITTLTNNSKQKHTFFTADFNDNNEVKKTAETIASVHHIDILINNTGGPPAGKAHEADIDAYLSAFKNHLINNQILAQAFIPQMKSKQFGRIINVISTSVKVPLHNLGVSNTIRGAVGNWSKTLANELASYNITVNNILPGATETERLSSIIKNKSEKLNTELENIRQEMLNEIPMGRFAKPEEIAYAAVFLASVQASYITGTNTVVDGGRTPCL